MLLFKRLFLVFLCLIPFLTFAGTPSAADELTGLLSNMRSMQATFMQTIMDKNEQALQKVTGSMALKRPSLFRWETLHPNHQLIVTNGKRLWIYDPDLEQVTIRQLIKAAGETPAMLLSDANLSLTKEFIIKKESKNSDALEWFHLTPKDKSNMISSLRLGFSHHVIHEMRLQDNLGHTTYIVFNNIKMNPTLLNSIFNFKPPLHVDTIDETQPLSRR